MTTPNQITVVCTKTMQQVHRASVRMYDEKEGKYGLLMRDYLIFSTSRGRKEAMARARDVAKMAKLMSAEDARAFLNEITK